MTLHSPLRAPLPHVSVTGTTRSDIQGLRALAVVAVIAFHAAPSLVGGGFVGVDVFFVISGFLISTQLLNTWSRRGTISLAEFYAARVRRLVPAAALVTLVTLIASWVLLPQLLMGPVVRDAIDATLYVPNIVFAWEGSDYWASTDVSLFKHYWSLGVEEQFYIVWPALLLLALRAPRRVLPWLLAALAVSGLLASILVTGVSQPWAFYSLPTRAWEFAVGALLAVLPLARLSTRVSIAASWIGVIGLAVVVMGFTGALAYPGAWAALPVAFTALVIAGMDRPGTATLALGLRPIRYVGDISYSLYLWHWPALMLLPLASGEALTRRETVFALLLTIVLSIATYHFVENPLRRTPGLRSPRRSLALGVGASVTVIGIALASAVVSFPTTSSPASVEARTLPSALSPSLAEAEADRTQVSLDGCHADMAALVSASCTYGKAGDNSLRVVLFGDSHAAQWFPALYSAVQSRHGELLNLTKSACPPVSMTVRNGSLKRDYVECDTWRANAIERINDWSPDLIVVSAHSEGYRTLAGDDFDAQWSRALAQTLSELQEPTVLIANTPLWPEAVPACLARNAANIDACSAPVGDVRDLALSASEERAGGRYVDMTDVLCPNARCAAIEGDLLMYRDTSHLTATYSESLSEKLWSRIAGTE